MSDVNRVLTILLLAASVLVAGAVVYVLVHDSPVPQAGETPGFTVSPIDAVPSGTESATGSGAPSSGLSPTGSQSPPASTATIAFIGDDWTLGAGVDKSKRFTNLLAAQLGVQLVVAARDGAGYAKPSPASGDTYRDLVDAVVAKNPDIVVVSGGRNDVSDDAATLQSATKALFARLADKLPQAKLVAVAPFWGDSAHPADLTAVDKAVQTAVEAAGGTYLALTDPLRGHSEWMADAADPNEKGYVAIASALAPELTKLLPT